MKFRGENILFIVLLPFMVVVGIIGKVVSEFNRWRKIHVPED